MRHLEKLSIQSFLFHLKTVEVQRGYKFIPEKMFSGIKSDFFRVLLESMRSISNCDDSFHFGKGIFVTSYLQM